MSGKDRHREIERGELMKRRLALVLVATASALGAVSAGPATPTSAAAPVVSAKSCSSRYVHGIIGGEHKCLRTGQFCARRHERQYHRYGFHCHRYYSNVGRYRLTRRP